MKNRISGALSLAGALIVLLVSSAGDASVKIKNNTSNTVFAAQDRTAVCGWECTNGWRSLGWWQIAPGGTVTVWGSSANKVLFTYFAEDGLGHTWRGSEWQHSVCSPFAVFDNCTSPGPCATPNRSLTYGASSVPNFCCGIFCGFATDHTIVLNL